MKAICKRQVDLLMLYLLYERKLIASSVASYQGLGNLKSKDSKISQAVTKRRRKMYRTFYLDVKLFLIINHSGKNLTTEQKIQEN